METLVQTVLVDLSSQIRYRTAIAYQPEVGIGVLRQDQSSGINQQSRFILRVYYSVEDKDVIGRRSVSIPKLPSFNATKNPRVNAVRHHVDVFCLCTIPGEDLFHRLTDGDDLVGVSYDQMLQTTPATHHRPEPSAVGIVLQIFEEQVRQVENGMGSRAKLPSRQSAVSRNRVVRDHQVRLQPANVSCHSHNVVRKSQHVLGHLPLTQAVDALKMQPVIAS